MISRLSFQSAGSDERSQPNAMLPSTSTAVRARPPTTARNGRCGSTSRPPGAPLTNAVVSRRRLNDCASTRSFLVAIGSEHPDGGGGERQQRDEHDAVEGVGEAAETDPGAGGEHRE